MEQSSRNRLANCDNRYQGTTKKVLCVCSAGLLRSPTMAVVLSQEPYNYNTRSVGITEEYALTPLEHVHLEWADEIVCAEGWMAYQINSMLERFDITHPVVVSLDIPDKYGYRDPELIQMIKEKYNGNNT